MDAKLTTIPKVHSGYKQLDYAKDMGYAHNTTVQYDNLVDTNGLVVYNDGNCDMVATNKIVDAWYLPSIDTTLLLKDNGYLEWFNNGEMSTTITAFLPYYMCSTMYDYDGPVVIIRGQLNGYMFDSGSVTFISSMPMLQCMTQHYGRVFGIVDNRVHYCKLLDPTDWSVSLDAGGYVDMPSSIGQCHTIISRGDYLYIVGNNGIAQLYAKSDATAFRLTVLASNVTDICSGTAVLCGDNIWWVSSSGVYQLDGTDVELMVTLDDDVVYDYTSTKPSTYYQGKLIVPMAVQYPDNNKVGCEQGTYTCNTLLVVDTHTCTYQLLRGIDAQRVVVANKLGVVINDSDTLYTLDTNTDSRRWVSSSLTLSGCDHKRIDSVVVDTQYPVTLTVASGKQSRSFNIEQGRHRVQVRLRGNSFTVSLSQKCQYMHIEPIGIYYTAFGTDKTGG